MKIQSSWNNFLCCPKISVGLSMIGSGLCKDINTIKATNYIVVLL